MSVHKISSGTDSAGHCLFDPVALSHVLADPEVQLSADDQLLVEEAEKGNLFGYSNASDGGVIFGIFLDERPPDVLLSLSRHSAKDHILHLPSGILWACGTEYVSHVESADGSPESFAIWPEHMGQKVKVPPGDYLVDAYELPGPADAWTPVPCSCSLALGGIASVFMLALGAMAFLARKGAYITYAMPLYVLGGLGLLVTFICIIVGSAKSRRDTPQGSVAPRSEYDVVIHLRALSGGDSASYRGGVLWPPATGVTGDTEG